MFSFSTKLLAIITVVAASASVQAYAQSITPGSVACISRKAAVDYARFTQSAPAFAEDLLARAACYKVEDPSQAILRTKDAHFAQFQLLSGHKVWVSLSSVVTQTQP